MATQLIPLGLRYGLSTQTHHLRRLHHHHQCLHLLISSIVTSSRRPPRRTPPHLLSSLTPPPFRAVGFRTNGLRLPRQSPSTDETEDESDSDSEGEVAGKKSRNERKREARRAVKWGMELFKFSNPQIKRIMRVASLEQEVFEALMLVKRLGPDVREGRRRQFSYIGRLLRNVQPDLLDALIQASKDGDYDKLQALSSQQAVSIEDDEEDEGKTEFEDEEGCHEHIELASRWFEGLVHMDSSITNEVYSVRNVEFDRQELRKLVREVQSTQKRQLLEGQEENSFTSPGKSYLVKGEVCPSHGEDFFAIKRSLSATFTFTNNCDYTIWPGILSNAGTPELSTTGFPLQKSETQTVSAPSNWSGRMWARTLCSTDPTTGAFTCATGDCGSGKTPCSGGGAAPPATLAEFTLAGANGLDFYDVSLVDGYNLPILVAPRGGSGNCSSTGCLADLNGPCPSDLKVVSKSNGGSDSVACRSACEAYGAPQYCCSGAYGNPNTSSERPVSLDALRLSRNKPELEHKLLSALVNKLGDPERKATSCAEFRLSCLLSKFPNMKSPVKPWSLPKKRSRLSTVIKSSNKRSRSPTKDHSSVDHSVKGATFTFINKCDHPVWPGILSSAGSPPLGTTGFELPQGTTQTFDAPTGWSGRFWGRTGCKFDSSGRGTCTTGDCGSDQVACNGAGAAPPATLAEFTLGSPGSKDFYDVSLVDGYNLPMMVDAAPSSLSSGAGGCGSTGCVADMNARCPAELRTMDGTACRSACEAFGKPEYCCSGEFGSPDKCAPSVYSQMFKSACPRSYSYAYDDATSTFTCASADYTITFCPDFTSLKSSRDSTQPQAAAAASTTTPQQQQQQHHHQKQQGCLTDIHNWWKA
ncbi:Thaumatin-like protein 1 [Acorus calamus]|uniref:Thaumatin-like protein 1 n=1 Tax=Acorus calamus TaxID=4465 RepID=A0AAV9DX22_ACOCL|nr:Thaumatin-like protein 1 [Acorus calamus]